MNIPTIILDQEDNGDVKFAFDISTMCGIKFPIIENGVSIEVNVKSSNKNSYPYHGVVTIIHGGKEIVRDLQLKRRSEVIGRLLGIVFSYNSPGVAVMDACRVIMDFKSGVGIDLNVDAIPPNILNDYADMLSEKMLAIKNINAVLDKVGESDVK